MESEYLYHITSLQEWEAAKIKNEYTPQNYEKEGFIHCSIEKQIPGVLDRFYKGQKGLVKDRKSTRLNSSHSQQSRMPSSA